MTKRVALKDFAKELEGFSKLTIEHQKAGFASGLARSLPYLAQTSPVDTGLYASSWDFTITEKEAIIGNYAPHAPIIEFGARPYTPPIAPLLAWAKRVLQDPSQPPDYSEEVWGLAMGVRNKIEKFGQEPKSVLANALSTIIENVRQELIRIGAPNV